MSAAPAPSNPVAAARAAVVGAPIGAWALTGAIAGLAMLVGAGLGMVLSAKPPPVGIVAVGSFGLLAILGLAVVRLWAAVLLGVALLAVVRVEPAPSDAVFAIVLVIATATGRVYLDRVPDAILLLVGGYLLVNVVSATSAIDTPRALLFFGITLYLVAFAVWLAGAIRSEGHARGVLLAYLWAAVLSAAAGALAMNVGFPGSEVLIDKGGTRARALFEDANVYAPFLVPAALIVLHEIIRPNLLRARVSVKVLIFAVLALGILLSYSRAAWANLILGIAVMVLVLALRGGYGPRLVRLMVVLALAGAALAVVVVASGNADFVNERASLQSYDQERFSAQREGIALGEANPLGIGPGQYEVVVDYAAHSTYVRAFAEHGLLGLTMLVGLLYGTLLFAARNALTGRDAFGLPSAALLGAWCGLLMSSFVVDTLHWRHLWFVAALIWAASMLKPTRPAVSTAAEADRDALLARTDALLREATDLRRQLSGMAYELRSAGDCGSAGPHRSGVEGVRRDRGASR